MLVLTRRPGEELIITLPDGSLITVAVLGLRGNQIRLGVEAPKNVAVDRLEIYQRKMMGMER